MHKANSAGQKQTNLFIKGLKEGTTEGGIKEAFSQYGEITSTSLRWKELKTEAGGVKSGFAFINFSNAEQAQKAFEDGKVNDVVKDLVNFDIMKENEFLFFAQSKMERKKYLRNQHFAQNPNSGMNMNFDFETMMQMMMGMNLNQPNYMNQQQMYPMMGQNNFMQQPQFNTGFQGNFGGQMQMPFGVDQNMAMNPMMMNYNQFGFNNMNNMNTMATMNNMNNMTQGGLMSDISGGEDKLRLEE